MLYMISMVTEYYKTTENNLPQMYHIIRYIDFKPHDFFQSFIVKFNWFIDMLASYKGYLCKRNCGLISLFVQGSEKVNDFSLLIFLLGIGIRWYYNCTIMCYCQFVRLSIIERVIFLYLFINLQLHTYVIIVRVFS